jgi:hypothetical protein
LTPAYWRLRPLLSRIGPCLDYKTDYRAVRRSQTRLDDARPKTVNSRQSWTLLDDPGQRAACTKTAGCQRLELLAARTGAYPRCLVRRILSRHCYCLAGKERPCHLECGDAAARLSLTDSISPTYNRDGSIALRDRRAPRCSTALFTSTDDCIGAISGGAHRRVPRTALARMTP